MQCLCFTLLTLGISAALLSSPGTPDLGVFVQWADSLVRDGPLSGYAAIADYPPLGPFLLWIVVSLGRVIELPDLLSVKLAIALFQLASALIVLIRYHSWTAACLLWLLVSPFGLLLGYIDAFYLPFVLLAVFALERDRLALGSVMLAMAALIKWQPVIFGPVIVVYGLSRSRSIWKLNWTVPAAICISVVLATFGPFTTVDAFLGAASDPFFSGQAFNLNWVITGWLELRQMGGAHLLHGNTITAMTSLDPSWRILSRGIFWPVYFGALAIFASGRKSQETLLLTLTTCEAVQFTFNTGVHENHLFLVMILAFVTFYGGALDSSYLVVISALSLSNILLFYGLSVGSGTLASIGTVILSLLSILVSVTLFCILVVSCRRGPGLSVPPAVESAS